MYIIICAIGLKHENCHKCMYLQHIIEMSDAIFVQMK